MATNEEFNAELQHGNEVNEALLKHRKTWKHWAIPFYITYCKICEELNEERWASLERLKNMHPK